MKNKTIVSCFAGTAGSLITSLYGGWTQAMTTLCIFMLIDYLTGICVALIGKSGKSQTGALSSKAGFLGLIKKGMIMLTILVAYRLDLLLDTTYIKDASCIAFILNETISIIENVGLFIPIPRPILKAIDILKSKEDENNEK